MQRTTTAATLLVTVAVTALSGCVTVHRPSAPGPHTAPSGAAAPDPNGVKEPQIVQAPAREALERTAPSKEPRPVAPAPRRAAPPPAPAPAASGRPHPRPSRPAPRPEPHRPEPRTPTAPAAPEAPGNTDVCALGRTYGGWKADSPQAVICSGAYGN
ncbi:hypothetical protein ACGFS9_31200 [Streptomyces sp. NPDC048566]|uniref:hypothetical protein n=1 Tax=Streptomyces sp. NPDC048566 TaxID=3365569 RepID=UPI0037137C4A